MMQNNIARKKGADAEAVVSAYLTGKGWIMVTANYRSNRGEIDLIGLEKTTMVFVEVKSGKKSLGDPSLRVGLMKQRRIITTANQYIQKFNPKVEGFRFDVVSLVPMPNGEWEIDHLKDAFRPESEN